MATAIIRIKSDIEEILKTPLDNIFTFFDESDIYHLKALIIGAKNTPYERGFFVFDIRFPDTYPMKPPVVKFETIDNSIRFNPNLYRDGKVCLSILNTWSGPQWTPCNTLSSVLVSMLAMVFNSEPLRNEPGHQDDSKDVLDRYNDFVKYQTMHVAVYHMLHYHKLHQNDSELNRNAYETMQKYYKENYQLYDDIIQQELAANDGKIIETEYGMKAVLNYSGLTNNFCELRQMYGIDKKFEDMKINELRELASGRNISLKKSKNGRMVNKTRQDLIADIQK